MRVQAEPTQIFCNFSGTRVRVWNAVTEDGVQCFLFVSFAAARAGEDPGPLAEVLTEQPLRPDLEEIIRGML